GVGEPAAEVAAGRPEGQHGRTRQEVIERLLLDGINAKAAGAAVRGQHDLPVLACPHEAEAALPFVELAQARAQVTLDAPVFESVPVAGRNDRGIVAYAQGEFSSLYGEQSGCRDELYLRGLHPLLAHSDAMIVPRWMKWFTAWSTLEVSHQRK